MPRKAAPTIDLNCQVCGSKFETRDTKRGRERKTCGKSCASKLAYKTQETTSPCVHCGTITTTAQSVISSGLPVYCDDCAKARYENACAICGDVFMAKRAYVKCCSQKCVDKLNEQNLASVECDHCGKVFHRPSRDVYSGKRSFCSIRCRDARYSVENPTRYGGTWPRWVRTIRRRDNNKCLKCGSGKNLQVHHFKKLTQFENPNDAHYDANLGLFCFSCHLEVEDMGYASLYDFLEDIVRSCGKP